MQDYSGLIRDVVQPKITETWFAKPLKDLQDLFTNDVEGAKQGGKKILKDIRTSVTSNSSNYTKADVNPAAGSFVTVPAYWNRTYQHTAVEVHGIDKNQAQNGGSYIGDLLTDAIATEMPQFWQLIYNNVYTQIKADIDATAAYSDAALSRSTYTTLASYEEATDTQITLAYLRTCSNSSRLNKNTSPKSGYLWVMEQQVYDPFEPLAAALHTWNVNGVANSPVDGGYQVIGNFEGTNVATPQGMTTGDVFFVRPQDVNIQTHRTFEIEQVESGKDSVKMVIRTGINAYVDNPGFQGKMTSKD